jgi:hypothetical protein
MAETRTGILRGTVYVLMSDNENFDLTSLVGVFADPATARKYVDEQLRPFDPEPWDHIEAIGRWELRARRVRYWISEERVRDDAR